MERKIIELIESIRNLAPEVWEVLVYQQAIEAWILAGLTVLTTVVSTSLGVMSDADGVEWFIAAIGYTVAIVFGVLAILHFFNPEFYAIKELLPR